MDRGFHITALPGKTLLESIKFYHAFAKRLKLNFNVAQIFATGPKNYRVVDVFRHLVDRRAFRAEMRRMGIAVYVHGSYVDYPWKGSVPAIANIKRELKICGDIGARGLIIHLPKAPLGVIKKTLPRIMFDKPARVKLILEINSAKSGPDTYETPAKLNRLLEHIARGSMAVGGGRKLHYKSHIGVCVDTAHIWACGADITLIAAARAWLKAIKYPKLVRLIHFNDDRNRRGSGNDCHAVLGTGQIWGSFRGMTTLRRSSGIRAFAEFARKHKIPIVFERHYTDTTSQMKRKNDLIKEFKLTNS